MLENKKIFILGMAKSGYEVAKLLSHQNNTIVISDVLDQDEDKIQELNSLGITFIKSDTPEDLLDASYDIVIKNPAVFPSHACLLKAKELNIKIVNEMEVAYHYINKDVFIIGVTGSNGKTTTTTLIYEMLKSINYPVKLGGNIGIPLSNIVNTLEDGDILLLEISDHQLISFDDFKTNISVLTNLCPTHLDYHGSYDAYKQVKKHIFNHHTKDDIAIINYTNQDSVDLTSDIASSKVFYNDSVNYIGTDGIYIDNTLVVKFSDILIKGMHNYENILMALLVMKSLNIELSKVTPILKTFKGVEHRIEYVAEINGVKYYNDSKSTNPTATITALKSFDSPIHLILGGLERKQDFSELDDYLTNVECIYAIGEVRDRIVDYAASKNKKVYSFETLKEAVEQARVNAKEGDIVLLSPGSASWDQYKRFEDRGDEFKSLVQNI